MQEPMAMEILMTSQQSYSILRGTQLRVPSRVLLEIACTCIMHRDVLEKIYSFGLVDVKALTFHATREMMQGGGRYPRDIFQAYLTAPFRFFSKFETQNSNRIKLFGSQDMIIVAFVAKRPAVEGQSRR